MTVNKPKYLWHGSTEPGVDVLLPAIPLCAQSVHPSDNMDGVYATHVRDYAVAFGLTKFPSKNGSRAWSLDIKDSGDYRIVVLDGKVDLSKNVYLYKLPSDTFEKVDDWQWVSFEPVKPVEIEVIDPRVYKPHIIENRLKVVLFELQRNLRN